MKDKVNGVAIGLSKGKQHFISIMLESSLTDDEVVEMSSKRIEFKRENFALDIEFIGRELCVFPSVLAAEYFETLKKSVEQYQLFLKFIGLDFWADNIVIDGDLRRFDERAFPMKGRSTKKIN